MKELAKKARRSTPWCLSAFVAQKKATLPRRKSDERIRHKGAKARRKILSCLISLAIYSQRQEEKYFIVLVTSWQQLKN